MPRISEFYGIVIEMYFADHPPPHFHARYGGEEATIMIASGAVLAGSLPGRALRLVREWLVEHRRGVECKLGTRANPRSARAHRTADMNELIKVRNVEPIESHWIRLWFSDGAVKDVDVGGLLEAGGVFAPIREGRELFEQVRVNPETQTVEWPGGVDLDPDVLYGSYEPASGVQIKRRTVREPSSAAHA